MRTSYQIRRLTRDVENPSPDRRKRYDFWATPVWKAGTLISLETWVDSCRDGVPVEYQCVAAVDRSGQHHVRTEAAARLLAASEPLVPSTLREAVLCAHDYSGDGIYRGILEQLVLEGRVALADIGPLVGRYRERIQREYESGNGEG